MSDWTCNTCGAKPCVNPSFCRACRKADAKPRPPLSKDIQRAQRMMADNVTLEHAWAEFLRDRPTPQSTLDRIAWETKYGRKSGKS